MGLASLIADLGLELARAAQILVRDMVRVKPGEDVLIYADTESDWRTVEETSKAVHSVGGRVATMGYPTPRGVGEAADPDIPAPLGAAMSSCDVIIEFSSNYLLYSTPWRKAMETQRIRYLCLSGVTAEMMVRCVGRVNLSVLVDFQEKIAELTKGTRQMRITTPAGTNIQFEMIQVDQYSARA